MALAATEEAMREVLPTEVKPTHYDLKISTDLDAFLYGGSVDISLDVLQETKEVTFNSMAHQLKSVSLLSEGVTSVTADEIKLDTKLERATAVFSQSLKKGSKATLRIVFTADLKDSPAGYYRTSWDKGSDGKEWYSATQFEPTAARRAFPCWDEPALKATFALTLIARSDYVHLANMNEKSHKIISSGQEPEEIAQLHKLLAEEADSQKKQTHGREMKLTQFETSPLMSTYLVAWVIGPLKHIEGTSEGGAGGKKIPVRIYATPDNVENGTCEYALEVAIKVLPLFAKMFDIPYPLPKLDFVALHDFEAGAMENWGLITGRISGLIWDPKNSGLQAKKRVCEIVAHEIAHMWFGDVVTPEWWEGLWLNEGFATWMALLATNRIHPEWKIMAEFASSDLQRALNLDSLRSSHPVEVPVKAAGEIMQIFDAISYQKGASVIRMLSNFLGEEVFLRGVSNYLKAHLYGNAQTNDLWAQLSKASGKNVQDFIVNWTRVVGYPVITIADDPNGKVSVRQNRFLKSGDVKAAEDKTIWRIPLLPKVYNPLTQKTHEDKDLMLSQKEKTLDIDAKNHVFKLNSNSVGVYRCNYSSERLAKLGNAIRTGHWLSVEDRIGLVSDSANMARSGAGKTSGFLGFIGSMANELDYVVWSEIDSHLSAVSRVWSDEPEPVQNAINTFTRSLYGPLAKKLGFENGEKDDTSTTQLRALAIAAAARSKDKEVLAEIKSRFDRYIENGDGSAIPPDLRKTIYSEAVKNGGEKEWNAMRKEHANPKSNPQQKIASLVALSSTQQPDLVQKLFTILLSDEIKAQDVYLPISGLSMNPKFKKEIWYHVRDHYDDYVKMLDGSFVLLAEIFCRPWSFWISEKDLDKEVIPFFKTKDTSKYSNTMAQAVEGVRSNAQWLERDRDDVLNWLQGRSYLPPGENFA